MHNIVAAMLPKCLLGLGIFDIQVAVPSRRFQKCLLGYDIVVWDFIGVCLILTLKVEEIPWPSPWFWHCSRGDFTPRQLRDRRRVSDPAASRAGASYQAGVKTGQDPSHAHGRRLSQARACPRAPLSPFNPSKARPRCFAPDTGRQVRPVYTG